MARTLGRRIAAAGIVIALAVPAAALAAEPQPAQDAPAIAAQAPSAAPIEPAPSDPVPTLAPGDPGYGQGEVVIDGPFVTPTPEGSVLDAIREPRLTPPPTDAVARTGPPAMDHAWQQLLALIAGASALIITLGTTASPRRNGRGRRAVRARAATPATRTTPGRRTRR
jgi:hypothetical protein